MLLNNEWVNDEIKEEIKRYLETNKDQVSRRKEIIRIRAEINEIESKK